LKTPQEIQQIAIEVIAEEKKAVESLAGHIDNSFSAAVETIFCASGRVIFTGIGKSANIAAKVVSTLNSTGTPALFMHAADAIHGDLGMVQPADVVVCVSKSGNTPEIKVLIPLVKNFGNKLIAIVGNTDSFLAREADIVLNTTVAHEACPNNLAPTSSTTAQLVMGDALAIALMACRNFSASDFARFHPGGSLGKRLLSKVRDFMATDALDIWRVSPQDMLSDVITKISQGRKGLVVALDEHEDVVGIITDGDVRRAMQRHREAFFSLKVEDVMTRQPKQIHSDAKLSEAADLMLSNSIHALIVLDRENRFCGIIDYFACV